ncbi:MAG: tRNA lysidine(34) synthetase TilS [Bacteroidota bacterium]
MDLFQKFEGFIKEKSLFQRNDKLLLAVSGGIDSVVLCELCFRAGYDFSIAHCNFKLRGEHSDSDEQFVKELAKKYNVPFYVKSFNTTEISKENKRSIEETARDLRYQWFNELLQSEHFQNSSLIIHNSKLLTAHHADDNIETVLMNFFRGTGIKGLHGILPKQNKLIRPLLFAAKDDIADFAKTNNLSFVTDHTNAETEYTRNYFRNVLIPGVEKIFPKAKNNILNNIERFGEAEIFYSGAIESYKKKIVHPVGNEIHLPILKLLKIKPLNTLMYEIIKDFNFTALQTKDVIALLTGDSGKYVQSPTHRVFNNRKWLIISPNKTNEAENILIGDQDKLIVFSRGNIHLKDLAINGDQLSSDNKIAMLDIADITYPLLLRKWKKGDYFYPLGMDKKKKLSRFFGDLKLSLTEKENVWVIESNKKIIWVVGLRIDNRFKVKPNTKKILQITLTPSK